MLSTGERVGLGHAFELAGRIGRVKNFAGTVRVPKVIPAQDSHRNYHLVWITEWNSTVFGRENARWPIRSSLCLVFLLQ